MDILITGASGMVGSALVVALMAEGHNVKTLVRSKEAISKSSIYWDPEKGSLATERLEKQDAIIHLAGENIAGKNPIQGRWTKQRKEKIKDSRVKGTKALADTLAKLTTPPKVFITASAIGFYGDRGNEKLTEESKKGKGFLADVCQEWEAMAAEAAKKDIRVVNMRFGVILSKDGGALKSMMLPFKMGAGGTIGSGKQFMSWIDLDDVVGAIIHAIKNESLKGPVNVVAPNAVTNADFTRILGHSLKRPTFVPVPAAAVKILFGEMGEELLLSSTRVVPQKLLDSGYQFKYPQLSNALTHILK